MKNDGKNNSTTTAPEFKFNEDQTLRILNKVSNAVLDIQNDLKANHDFESTAVLGLPENPSKRASRIQRVAQIKIETKRELRSKILTVLDELLQNCKLGNLIRGCTR